MTKKLSKPDRAEPLHRQSDPLALYRREDPTATTVGPQGDLILASQLSFIRHAAREKQVDADEVCRDELHCDTASLSRDAAEAFIIYLSRMETTRA